MGNKQLMRTLERREDDDEGAEEEEQIKKKSKLKKQVQPYNHDAVDTGFVSPIKQFLPSQQEETLFVKRPEQLENKNVFEYVQELHKKFPDEEITEGYLDSFIKGSRENIIGRQKFLQFIWAESELSNANGDDGIGESYIPECQFVQLFFKSCSKTIDHAKTGQFMDYSKLLKMLHLMHQGSTTDHLEFFFQLFDGNCDGKIERDELNYFYTIFFEFLLQAPFMDRDETCEDLKYRIQNCKEKDIANAIKKMSDGLNQQYCSKEGYMAFENWQQLMDKEYLNYIDGVSSSLLESELQQSPNKNELLNRKNKQDVSFTLESVQSVTPNPNVFTNFIRNGTFNQTLPTETEKKEEQQMIYKNKKENLI